MRSLIQDARDARTMLRVTLLSLAATLVAAACSQQDHLPLDPRIERANTAITGTSVTVLPNLGGPVTVANDINDAGQVVGWSLDRTATRRAFVWSPTEGMQDLGTLGGTTSEANAINAGGEIVGSSETTDRRTHAFLWTPRDGMQDLGTLDDAGSVATDIDNRGQVVGFTFSQLGSTFVSRAVLWAPRGNMSDLGTLGGWTAGAVGINNAGHIVGSGVTADGDEHPFLWTPQRGMVDLGGPNAAATDATAINARGDIIGVVIVQPDAHPFIWTRQDGLRMIGGLGGPDVGLVHDINDAGQVVGSIAAMPGGRHAFVWLLGDGMQDLYASTGMTDARAINNRGQVVGGNRVATIRNPAHTHRNP